MKPGHQSCRGLVKFKGSIKHVVCLIYHESWQSCITICHACLGWKHVVNGRCLQANCNTSHGPGPSLHELLWALQLQGNEMLVFLRFLHYQINAMGIHNRFELFSFLSRDPFGVSLCQLANGHVSARQSKPANVPRLPFSSTALASLPLQLPISNSSRLLV